VREQFEIHCIVERLNEVDKMTRYCGYPSPSWLRAMIIKLYKQMTEIRVHADKDCWKYNCMRRISTATTVLTHRRVTDPLLTENPT